MAALLDGQWELAYPPRGPFPGAEFVFGPIASGNYLLEPPDLGETTFETQDVQLPGEDGLRRGVDTQGGRTVTFEMGVDRVDAAQAWAAGLNAMAELSEAWNGDAVRKYPGATATLRTRNAGRTSVIYGRPRRFAPTPARFDRRGYASVVCDFSANDFLYYDDVEQFVDLSLVPPAAGGLEAPLASPLSTVAQSVEPGAITVGGHTPTWPVITIYGPVSRPVVTITGVFTVVLDETLAYDQWVTVDARPWARTVTRNDGANLTLTPTSTPLSRLRLPLGAHEVVFRGEDQTGTASMRFAWRDAARHLLAPPVAA